MASKHKARIEIAKGLEFDASAATQTFGVLARKRAGKTYLAGKLVEELHRVGCPVTVIDPVGNWWGLTLAANGKDPGLPFLVLGGEKGDVELSPDGGRPLAEFIVERRMSSVLDVSDFDDEQRARFVADFLERFLIRSKQLRQVHMIVFEEVHLIAPERHKGFERALRRVEKVVRVGGNYGTGCMLLSQRPQSVNKEVLSQVECLFVGQLVESHGRKSIRDWVVEKGIDVKRRIDEAASLEAGEFFCWSPVWLQTFKKVKILPKWTFDASRTPVLGDEAFPAQPRERVTSAELAALKAALAKGAVRSRQPEERDGDDALLREAEQARADAEAEAVRLRGELEEQRATLRRAFDQYELLGGLLGTLAKPEGSSASVHRGAEDNGPRRKPNGRRGSPRVDRTEAREAATNAVVADGDGSTVGAGLPPVDKCQRAIMTVLIQQRKALSMKQLGMTAVYAPSSGGFKNAVSKLRKRGWIEGRGSVMATSKGTSDFIAEFGPVPRLPSGEKLFDFWLHHRRVDKCGRAVLTALREHGGGPLAPGDLAQKTEPPYAASSGGFKNTLSKLRTLGLIEGRGTVELVSTLR